MPDKPEDMTPPAPAPKLTPKQALFIREYLIDKNGTQAAIRAGYSEDCAYQQAYENLNKPEIEAEIKRQLSARFKRLDITADRILHELMLIATVDLAEAYDSFGALKPMHEIPEEIRRAIAGVEVFEEFEMENGKRVKIGETMKLKLIDKRGALELLAKNLKLLTDIKEFKADATLSKLLAASWKDEE